MMLFRSEALRRQFWSLYGRFVWDNQRLADRDGQIERVAGLLAAHRTAPDERVLDAGCGTGNYAIALAEAGFKATGIDYAPGMLARAQAKIPAELAERVTFRPGDLNRSLDFPEASFEHIINISVLQVTSDPVFTLKEFWRALRPGGNLLLLHFPRPESHRQSLQTVIGYRLANLDRRSPWRTMLVALKTWAERRGNTRYWTPIELLAMLQAARFEVFSVDSERPIIILARKPMLPW